MMTIFGKRQVEVLQKHKLVSSNSNISKINKFCFLSYVLSLIYLYRNVDFQMEGNSGELNHLIRPSPKGSPTRSDINFGFGLRKYNGNNTRSMKSLNGFHSSPWKFPGLKGAKDAISSETYYKLTQDQPDGSMSQRQPLLIGKGKKRLLQREGPYNDKFPQNNTSNIRHLFDHSSQVGSIKWESGLRWNSDKYMFINRRKANASAVTSRNHIKK